MEVVTFSLALKYHFPHQRVPNPNPNLTLTRALLCEKGALIYLQRALSFCAVGTERGKIL